jgi:hypothetical protein
MIRSKLATFGIEQPACENMYSLHYMSISGMSAIVLACQLAHMACVAELPKKVVRHLL